MDGDKAGLAFDRAPLRAKRGGGCQQREAKQQKERGEDEA